MFETISTIWGVVAPIIMGFGEQYTVIFSIIFIMGTARFFMKPIMAAVEAYIAQTPTKSDDLFINKIKENLAYKIVVFLLDWALSIKLPK